MGRCDAAFNGLSQYPRYYICIFVCVCVRGRENKKTNTYTLKLYLCKIKEHLFSCFLIIHKMMVFTRFNLTNIDFVNQYR